MPFDRTHDISNESYHVKDIKAFGEVLTSAAEAAFPNRGVSRYKEVHALLLSWEDDNLGVVDEVKELGDVFRSLYGFTTETWKIPSKRSHNSLAAKILGFLDDHESKDNLLIVYYGGHGEMNDDRQCVWSCTERGDSPEVQWYGLQTMLEQAKSDVLILLDCCAAASSATGNGTGITEIIAACGFEAWAPGVGQHSFTRSLIDELRYLRRTSPFSTSLLHNRVLSRVKYWKPRYDSSARHQEMRRTPIYIVVSNETRPRSIELEPRLPPLLIVKEDTATDYAAISPRPPLQDPALSSLSVSADASSASGPASESSCSSVSEVWPDKKFQYPKVLISVALEEEQWLSAPQWADWMRSIPGQVKYANVEGIYRSGSTLLLLSIPVAVWNLIPPSSAITFVGFSRSPNLSQFSSTVETATHQLPAVNQGQDDVDPMLLTVGSISEECHNILENEQSRFFFEVYLEEIAAWMDIFDSAKTFSYAVPLICRREPMLLYAVLAYLYDKATHALLRQARNRDGNTSLCAITGLVLNVFEMMSEQASLKLVPIAGARAVVKKCGWNANSSSIAAGCFWFTISTELLNCAIYDWTTAWNPDEWGYRLEKAGPNVKPWESPRTATEWIYAILHILARILKYSLIATQSPVPADWNVDAGTSWERLQYLCSWWWRSVPQELQPVMNSERSATSSFPYIKCLSRVASTANLFYHLAIYRLMRAHPSKKQNDRKLSSAASICGIMAHTKDRAVACVGLPALRVAGECLTRRDQQDEVLNLLNAIQKETGWRISIWRYELMAVWKRLVIQQGKRSHSGFSLE
ncbi:MAG: hypothetical protein Q9195_005850 [Heterodermia aff. obscurata]